MAKFPIILVGAQVLEGETKFEHVAKIIKDDAEFAAFKKDIVENCVDMWGFGCERQRNEYDIVCECPADGSYERWFCCKLDESDFKCITVA